MFAEAQSQIEPLRAEVKMLRDSPGRMLNYTLTLLQETHEHGADDVGEAGANQRLSEARACAVMNFLVRKRIDQKHLPALGLGSSRQIVGNPSIDGRAQNNRVELVKR